MSRKEQVKTGHPSRKSVCERLRFTSNAAEFTVATRTTGCRRNASSKKVQQELWRLTGKMMLKEAQNASTTKRKTHFIGAGRSTAVGNSGDVSRSRRALQLYAENRFLEIS